MLHNTANRVWTVEDAGIHSRIVHNILLAVTYLHKFRKKNFLIVATIMQLDMHMQLLKELLYKTGFPQKKKKSGK